MLIKTFDKIQILTTKNITWITGPDGQTPSPHGIWRVVCIIDSKDLLISKQSYMCRVPLTDVRIITTGEENGEEREI